MTTISDYYYNPLLAFCFHIQTPRYDSLKTLLSRTLQHFLTLDIAQSPASSNNLDTPDAGSDKPLQHTPTQPDSARGGMLASRMRELENHLLQSLPRNASDREKLIESGYSAKLWEEVFVVMYIIY